LESEEDAEYIIAKAIRDGVVDATLDHSKGYMKSKVPKAEAGLLIESLTVIPFLANTGYIFYYAASLCLPPTYTILP